MAHSVLHVYTLKKAINKYLLYDLKPLLIIIIIIIIIGWRVFGRT